MTSAALRPTSRARSILRLSALAGVVLLPLGLGGCASTPEENSGVDPEVEGTPYVPLPNPERSSIGYFLTDFDNLLKAWSGKRLAAQTEEEWRLVEVLEGQMQQGAWKRRHELIEVLESGPPINREVAAAALGFTRENEVVGPLLNALSDPRPEVVQKALLGLGVLADPATPLAQPLYLLRTSSDGWTRNNAAYAVYRVACKGGGDERLASTCREALFDDEPGVRMQCASILGVLGDSDSIEGLTVLLVDESSSICHAAAASLRRIGQEKPDVRGDVARRLVDALPRVDRNHLDYLFEELSQLRGENLGRRIDPWREWAYGLR